MAMMDTPTHPATLADPAEDDPRHERLVAALVRGEPGAERAFVRRFLRHVYGLATAIVGDGPRAEEVAMASLSRACRQAWTYDSRRGPVAGWMLRITRDLAVEARRRGAREPLNGSAVEAAVTLCGSLEASFSPGDAVGIGGRTAAVRHALSQLPLQQRRALVLAAVHGYTAEQISTVEAVPVETTRARIRSGLTMVNALLPRDTT
jgi:RNA polymerase sigma-70 factor (ECF subfamily)